MIAYPRLWGWPGLEAVWQHGPVAVVEAGLHGLHGHTDLTVPGASAGTALVFIITAVTSSAALEAVEAAAWWGPSLWPKPASKQPLLTVNHSDNEAGCEEPSEDAGGGQDAVGGRHQAEAATAHGPGLQITEVVTRHVLRAVTRGAALVTRGL